MAVSLFGQGAEQNHPELKSAALREFTYVPRETAESAAHPPGRAGTVTTVNPDAVVMDEVRVESRFWDKDLVSDVQKTKRLKAHSETKWGTGVHEKDFGKIRASVVTVLYVPILVNASW